MEPFYVLDYPTWVNVVAVTPENEVVLVRQYRHGVGRTVLELPGGGVEPEESPPAAAARELLEETGYEPAELVEVGVLSPNAANHSNLTHSFLASGCRRVAEPVQSEVERLEVELVSVEELARLALGGELVQALHVGAALFALTRLGVLRGPTPGR